MTPGEILRRVEDALDAVRSIVVDLDEDGGVAYADTDEAEGILAELERDLRSEILDAEIAARRLHALWRSDKCAESHVPEEG